MHRVLVPSCSCPANVLLSVANSLHHYFYQKTDATITKAPRQPPRRVPEDDSVGYELQSFIIASIIVRDNWLLICPLD